MTDNLSKFEKELETIAQIQMGYDDGSFSVQEVVRYYMDRIDTLNKKSLELNAINVINPDALSIAKELDEERENGKIRGPLRGIPVILKDSIDTADKMSTTCGSRALANSRATEDAFLVKNLREAGAVILGKGNLSEWYNFRGEKSSSGWSSVGGQTKNPYDISKSPSGSSSGSVVAVAANLATIGIGTETNGSIVDPSSNNGIVGMKPTVGLISRTGLIPLSHSLDSAGPMARSVEDIAITLGVLVGVDQNDTKTAYSEGKYHTDYTQFLRGDGLKGKRLGLDMSLFGINASVDEVTLKAVEYMKSQGVEIVEIDRVIDDEADDLGFEILLYETKNGLDKYLGVLCETSEISSLEDLIAFNKQDEVALQYFGQEYLEQAQARGDLDSQEYLDALSNLQKMCREDGIDRVMSEHKLDAIIGPSGGPAEPINHETGDDYPISGTSPSAYAGYPIITVPMGFVDDLPVGISFYANAWSEPKLLEIAYAYEQGTLHRRAPNL